MATVTTFKPKEYCLFVCLYSLPSCVVQTRVLKQSLVSQTAHFLLHGVDKTAFYLLRKNFKAEQEVIM